MLFALQANLHVLHVVFWILAVGAGLGVAYFASAQKDKSIEHRKRSIKFAQMAHEAKAEHVEKYFTADATGDWLGKLMAEAEMEKLADNPEAARRRFTRVAETWLQSEIKDPKRRREILHDIERDEKAHHGDEFGALLEQFKTIVAGTKEQAVVPTVGGGTTTVPIVHVHNHPTPPPPAPTTGAPATEAKAA